MNVTKIRLKQINRLQIGSVFTETIRTKSKKNNRTYSKKKKLAKPYLFADVEFEAFGDFQIGGHYTDGWGFSYVCTNKHHIGEAYATFRIAQTHHTGKTGYIFPKDEMYLIDKPFGESSTL